MVEKGGIGLVDPGQAVDLYEGMHSYLAKAGITGVKVDVIHVLEGHNIVNRFQELTTQLEKALSAVVTDKLDISDEVKEQYDDLSSDNLCARASQGLFEYLGIIDPVVRLLVTLVTCNLFVGC